LEPPPPALTIAIPTIGRLALFREALASALSQTVPVDVVASDNGSSDGTQAYLAALVPAGNLRIFRHGATMPVQDHGAFILSQIRTDWVVFLSDDDRLEPGFSAAILDAISQRPEVALVYTGCNMTYADVIVAAKTGPDVESAASFFFEFMNGRRNVCMCATAFRTRDWRSIGRQPDNCLIGDMYYWIRILLRGGNIGCIEAHLATYSFYRRGVRTETSRISPLTWHRETWGYAGEMARFLATSDEFANRQKDIERARAKFVALTTANQLIWSALRGASKVEIARSLMSLAGALVKDRRAMTRSLAALILPSAVLNAVLTIAARRRSAEKAAA